MFEQIAGWMTELAAFECDRIASGTHHIAPFPAGALIRFNSDSPILAVLQLSLSAFSDNTLDSPPFVLSHPDVRMCLSTTMTSSLESSNGVYVGLCPGGAAAYMSWLTVDWDPLFHGWRKDASPEANGNYDSPAELANYRKMYLDTIDCVSAGQSLVIRISE